MKRLLLLLISLVALLAGQTARASIAYGSINNFDTVNDTGHTAHGFEIELEGLHDIYIPTYRPHRLPIPLIAPEQRIGLPYIPVDPEKIVAIVITEKADSPSNVLPPDPETNAIAGHLNDFLAHEVKAGRLSPALQPLQAGIGTIASGVAK